MLTCPFCSHENLPGSDHCEGCHHDLADLSLPEPSSVAERAIMHESIAGAFKAGFRVKTIGPETALGEVVRVMAAEGVGAVLILDGEHLAGIFSERDIINRLGETVREHYDRPVRDFMTPSPECLGEHHSFAFALNRMVVGGYRHVPILEEGSDRPIGVLAIRDFMRRLQGHLDYVIAHPPEN